MRITPHENLHVTVTFLGLVDQKLINPISDAVEQAVRDVSTFTLEGSGLLCMVYKDPGMV